jgi:predicted AlkP superfamily phosphohydrolase/phosphomutase
MQDSKKTDIEITAISPTMLILMNILCSDREFFSVHIRQEGISGESEHLHSSTKMYNFAVYQKYNMTHITVMISISILYCDADVLTAIYKFKSLILELY